MDQLNRIEARLEKLDERLDTVDVTLVRNTVSLEEHMRRTSLLEQELRPIKNHVQLMNALAKVAAVAMSAMMLAHELGVLSWFKH